MSCRGRLGRSIRTGRSVKGMAHPSAILPPMVDDLARTEDELLRVVRAEGDFLTEIASHLIKAGGKRVRPGFAMASAAVLDPAGSPATIDVIRGGWP